MNNLDAFLGDTLQKLANSPDSEFEQSFFQLAFEQLQEELFNLLPFLVGFEVKNKSSDGTKALGVFGFKSNNGQILFVPAFFLNGTVKGINLLYSKNNEQFYPLNEDFAELFLKDEGTGIGAPSKDKQQEINKSLPPVDIKSLVQPPRTGKVSYASVLDFVEQADPVVKAAFQSLIETNDEYLESVLSFYPLDKIAKAIYVAETPAPAPKKKSVQVIKAGQDLSGLTDSQKEEVMKKGFILFDQREQDEKTEFGLEEYPSTFTNPSESGFYSYLTTDGGLRYGLIIANPMNLSKHGVTDESIILDLDSSNSQGYLAKTKDIFTKPKHQIKEFDGVVKNMLDPAEASPSYSDTYILINDKLNATAPFRIVMNYKDGQGLRRIHVEQKRESGLFSSNTVDGVEYWPKHSNSAYSAVRKGRTKETVLIMTKKPGEKLSFAEDCIYVPSGYKLLNVNLAWSCDSSCTLLGVSEASDARRKSKEDYARGKPGAMSTLMNSLRRNKVFPMTVASNGSEYFVSVNAAKQKYDSPIKAKIGMVLDYGLSEKQAAELIDSMPDHVASSKKGFLKAAAVGDHTFQLQDATPYANALGQPTFDRHVYTDTSERGDGYQKDPTRIGLGDVQQEEGLEGSVNQANQLAQSGQKELFDTHSIATLAKFVSPASKVSDYMPDFISCLDRLGRMLFLVHWQTDKFEQMYGRSEMPELVEMLTNVFKNLGELVVFLKRKSPELSINSSEEQISA